MSDALIELIRGSVIGEHEAVDGPFGARRVVYADYTASGRSLAFIEDFIRDAVLPLYANTHTESSGTGLQTTRLREDARRTIASCVGATDDHAVIFCGSGATGAIDKLIGILGLRIPSALDDRYHLSDHIPVGERPVVFIGPYEHHSNELPWRESIADVVTIPADADGHVDRATLASALERHADRPVRIGSFSAASNVTGIITDVADLTALLHEHGALAFWDYAAAAPYVDIDASELDAVFLSPHKMIGGPSTPGILVVRRSLCTNRVPVVPGGGTVAYVNPDEHVYLDDPAHREEGGTPAIVESIRAGLVFKLKEAVGVETIRQREEAFIRRAIAAWEPHPNIEILGNRHAERLSIVSFVVRHDGGYLHHNLVVALLDDLFGIQSRGGCSCAGPYGHALLGIDLDTSHEFERAIAEGCEGIKPGWVRVNFNYFIPEPVFDYIVEAVTLVASDGWRLLPAYAFDAATGLWRHRDRPRTARFGLDEVRFVPDGIDCPDRRLTASDDALADHLDEARALFARLEAEPLGGGQRLDLGADVEALRWFPLPDSAQQVD